MGSLGTLTILGVDPGQKGAIALLTVDNYTALPLSCIPSQDIQAVKSLLSSKAIIFMEKNHAYPGQGATAGFVFGHNTGLITGILWALGAKEIRFLDPRVWQRLIGIEGIKDKKQRKALLIKKAQELFPSFHFKRSTRCKTPDSGMADALLIAYAGLHLLNKE